MADPLVDGAPPAAIAGTAQALVPASSDTPTAAAIKRPATAGAIRPSRARPHRPGTPGSRPTQAAPATTRLHPRIAHTRRLAVTRIACSAVALTEAWAVAAGDPDSSADHDPGDGNNRAIASRPRNAPAAWTRADPAARPGSAAASPSDANPTKSDRLTLFATEGSEMEA